jgi:hypothetical protein
MISRGPVYIKFQCLNKTRGNIARNNFTRIPKKSERAFRVKCKFDKWADKKDEITTFLW